MPFYTQAQTLSQVSDTFALQEANGGRNTTAFAAGTAVATPIKAAAGRIGKVIVTVLGTAAMNIYDNASAASGTILCAIPASAPVGSIYDVQMPAANGITVGGVASSPGLTIGWD